MVGSRQVSGRLKGAACKARSSGEKVQANVFAQKAKVEQFEAQIDEKIAAVEVARVILDHTKASTPMNGVVVAVVTEEGRTLSSCQASHSQPGRALALLFQACWNR